MRNRVRHHYNQRTDRHETVEIRMTDPLGNVRVYLGSVNNRDVIGHTLMSGNSTPQSMGNAQSKRVAPSKAVSGWQREVIEFFEDSVYTVVEVR